MTHRHEELLDGKLSRAVLKAGRREQSLLPSHHVVGHAQARGAVPPRAIQDEHDLLAGARSYSLGKGGELGFEEGDTHRRGEVEDGPSRGRMDKAHLKAC